METRPDAGTVGSLNLVGGSSPSIIQFAGGHIDWDAGAVTTSIGQGQPLTSRPRREPYDVDYVAGTSMLVRRGVFEDVGLIPEQYFLYFEETDLQVKAAREGWKSRDEPARPRSPLSALQRITCRVPFYVYYYVRGRMLFGKEFTSLSDERLEAGLGGFVDGWRTRVTERAPDWLDTYDQLVAWAIADGKAGITGPRSDVDAIAGTVAEVSAPSHGYESTQPGVEAADWRIRSSASAANSPPRGSASARSSRRSFVNAGSSRMSGSGTRQPSRR